MCVELPRYSLHIYWLSQLNAGDPESLEVSQMAFVLGACVSLANSTRFASILSLQEFTLAPKKEKLWRQASMSLNGSSEISSWSTGHEDWDAKVKELAHRGVTLKALLDFYSDLPRLMKLNSQAFLK